MLLHRPSEGKIYVMSGKPHLPGGISDYRLPVRKKRFYKFLRRSPAIIQNVVAQPLSSLYVKIIIVRKCESNVTENRNVYKIS